MPDTSLNLNSLLTREEIIAREARRRQLLQRLDAKRPTARLEAIAECQRLAPNEISTLVSLAEREDTWLFPHWFRITSDVIIAIAVMGSVVGIIYGRTHPDFAFSAHILEYIGIWVALFLLVQCVHGEYHSSRYSARVRGSLRQIVIESQNPDIFPVVMRMLQMSAYTYQDDDAMFDKALYEAASRWLCLLSTEQIRAYRIGHQGLYRFLTPGRVRSYPAAALRVLQMLKEIGTSSAIPVVMPLTRDRLLHKNYQALRNAAEDCLAVLQERERRNRQPEMLLRASCAPAMETGDLLHPTAAPLPAPETLLRPLTTQVPAAAPEQLLRPSHNEE